MSERDVRAVESMSRTGICFDDLCDVFKQFSYEDIEVIFQRTRREISNYFRKDKEYSI
jgi:hypothetical protein